MRYRALATLSTLVLAGVLGVVLGGCARQAAEVPSQTSDPLAGATAAPLAQMTPADKTSKIATSFPVQVPVPVGRVP
jgi:hypothetical protein